MYLEALLTICAISFLIYSIFFKDKGSVFIAIAN